MQASEPGPAWPGFVKRSPQTRPRVGSDSGYCAHLTYPRKRLIVRHVSGPSKFLNCLPGAGANGRSDASVRGYIFDR
jgi:hypothetical protein